MVTYQRHLKNKIKKRVKHLYADLDVRSVLTPLPFVPFRSALKLRSHLVRSKLYEKLIVLNVTVDVVSLAIMLKNVTLSPAMSPRKRLK